MILEIHFATPRSSPLFERIQRVSEADPADPNRLVVRMEFPLDNTLLEAAIGREG